MHDRLFSEALWKKQEEAGSKPGKQIDKSVGNLWNTHQKKTSTLVIKHYKTVRTKAFKPPTENTKKVLEFYNCDDISRQLPYKNLTRKVKDHLGVCHCVPMRIMEVTLRNAFKLFKKDNASIKISQRTFEELRPKHICLQHCPAAAVLLITFRKHAITSPSKMAGRFPSLTMKL